MRGGPGEWLSGYPQVLGLAEAATCLVLPFSSQIYLLPPTGTDSGGSLAASAAKRSLVSWGLSWAPRGGCGGSWFKCHSSSQCLMASPALRPGFMSRSATGCQPNEGTFTVSPHYLQIWYLQIRLLAKICCYPQTVVLQGSLADMAE